MSRYEKMGEYGKPHAVRLSTQHAPAVLEGSVHHLLLLATSDDIIHVCRHAAKGEGTGIG